MHIIYCKTRIFSVDKFSSKHCQRAFATSFFRECVTCQKYKQVIYHNVPILRWKFENGKFEKMGLFLAMLMEFDIKVSICKLESHIVQEIRQKSADLLRGPTAKGKNFLHLTFT